MDLHESLCPRRVSSLKGRTLKGLRFEGAYLQVRRCQPFIFVIPNRLQPVRDLRFDLRNATLACDGPGP
jgi:hypothetical protein